MTTTPTTPTPGARPGDDLASFVREVDSQLRALGADAVVAVYGPAGPGGPELLEYLPGSRLIGWTAPPEVDRVVAVASGRAFVGDQGQPPQGYVGTVSADTRVQPISLSIGCDRRGRLAGRLRMEGTVQDEVPTGGRMVDALRRCFQLPTDPPPADSSGFLAALWLGAIAPTRPCRRRGGRMPWADALRLHPANAFLLDEEPDVPEWLLERVARRAPYLWSWEHLRRAAAANGALGDLCPQELAAWMDDGMFARWVLGCVAPLDQLAAAAAPRLEPAAAAGITALLADQGVGVDLGDQRNHAVPRSGPPSAGR